MIPRKFEYRKAKTLEDLLDFLSVNEDVKVLAGGQSLIPLMKLRVVSPKYLIDISAINELKYIKKEGNELRIGALVTHSEIEDSELIKKECPILSRAASKIADIHVRNMGTIGGSICHADPAADYLPVLLTLDAKLVLKSKHNTRIILVNDFLIGPFTIDLKKDEILKEIIIPIFDGYYMDYVKFARREGDLSIVNLAVLFKKGVDVRLAVGGVGPRAIRLMELEELLKKDGAINLNLKINNVIEKLEPPSDVHASSEYRKEIAKVLLSETLMKLYGGG